MADKRSDQPATNNAERARPAALDTATSYRDAVAALLPKLRALATEIDEHGKEPDNRNYPSDGSDLWIATLLLNDVLKLLEVETSDIRDDDEVAYYRLLLHNYAELNNRSATRAKLATIQAVKAKAISRKAASQILGVHQATVARWLKEYGVD